MTATETTNRIGPTAPVGGGPVVLPTEELSAALKDADVCRCRDTWRPPALASVLVERTDTELTFTATDSYTLIRRRVELEDAEPGSWVTLIDGDDLPTIAAHLRGRADVEVSVAQPRGGQWPRVTLARDGRRLVCSAVSGDNLFPNTAHLWPDPKAERRTGRVALNPQFVSRIGRLSESKGTQPARFFVGATDADPTLVRVGERTEMLLMPVRVEW